MWKFFKPVLKASAIVAALISMLVFIPNFLQIFVFLDPKLWGNSINQLSLITLCAFILIFLAFVLVLTIVRWLWLQWRKKHPVKTASANGVKALVTPDHLESSPQTCTNINNSFTSILISVLSIISGVVYSLYFVGRTYTDNYYSQLGIPSSFMNYSQQDYAYFGARIDTLIITFVYLLILIGFLRYWFTQQQLNPDYRKLDFIYSVFYLSLYSLLLLFLAFIYIFNPNLAKEPALIIAAIVATMITAGAQIMILFLDHGVLNRIRKGKVVSAIFIITIIVSLLFFPFISAKAWGLYMGFLKSKAPISNYPIVELHTTHKIIDKIDWYSSDNISYTNADTLYLVLNNDNYLILKAATRPNDIFVIKTEDVLSTTFLVDSNKTTQ